MEQVYPWRDSEIQCPCNKQVPEHLLYIIDIDNIRIMFKVMIIIVKGATDGFRQEESPGNNISQMCNVTH